VARMTDRHPSRFEFHRNLSDSRCMARPPVGKSYAKLPTWSDVSVSVECIHNNLTIMISVAVWKERQDWSLKTSSAKRLHCSGV